MSAEQRPVDDLFLTRGAEDLRIQLRKTRLSLILAVSFVVHLVFTASGFATAVGLYTLLAYALLVCLLSYALGWIGIDQYDLRDAMSPDIYPIRIRTPLHIEFAPYIAVWLAWWTVSELFRAALILYHDAILWQFFFFPALVILITWLRGVGNGGLVGAIGRITGKTVPLFVLQVATTATLFFPTLAWAPQHNRPLVTSARVFLYFAAVLLYDYMRPATTHVTLISELDRGAGTVDNKVRRVLRTIERDAENGGAYDQRRKEQVVNIVAAYECVANEHARAYEIATLNAWILVSPFIVGFVGFICAAAIFMLGSVPGSPLPPLVVEQRKEVEVGDISPHAQPSPLFTNPHPPTSSPPTVIATSSAFYTQPSPSPPPPAARAPIPSNKPRRTTLKANAL